jgi:hypothetical protein
MCKYHLGLDASVHEVYTRSQTNLIQIPRDYCTSNFRVQSTLLQIAVLV